MNNWGRQLRRTRKERRRALQLAMAQHGRPRSRKKAGYTYDGGYAMAMVQGLMWIFGLLVAGIIAVTIASAVVHRASDLASPNHTPAGSGDLVEDLQVSGPLGTGHLVSAIGDGDLGGDEIMLMSLTCGLARPTEFQWRASLDGKTEDDFTIEYASTPRVNVPTSLDGPAVMQVVPGVPSGTERTYDSGLGDYQSVSGSVTLNPDKSSGTVSAVLYPTNTDPAHAGAADRTKPPETINGTWRCISLPTPSAAGS